jgi:hypothetical protein
LVDGKDGDRTSPDEESKTPSKIGKKKKKKKKKLQNHLDNRFHNASSSWGGWIGWEMSVKQAIENETAIPAWKGVAYVANKNTGTTRTAQNTTCGG